MTSFTLKIIALTTMIIDHIGNLWAASIPNAFFMRCIGRVAFPLFAFMIAEGCKHTKDIKKYMLRLLVFALISEIPFDLFGENININNFSEITFLSFRYQNIFFNLFLSVFAIYIYESLKDTKLKYAGFLAFPAAAYAGFLINADYGYYAVPIIAAIYFSKNKIIRILAMVAGVAFLYLPYTGYTSFIFGYRVSYGLALFIFALIPAVLVFFYNGKRGVNIKYFFYLMYPLHLVVLAAINIFMITL